MKIHPSTRPGVRGREEFERAGELLRRVASSIPPRRASVEVVLVGAGRMASLNRTYRGRRGAPEILTFPYGGAPASLAEEDISVGGIVLCWPRIVAGAAARGVPVTAYLVRLLVHGLMHLKGYRHDTDRSERIMERAERRYLTGYLDDAVVAALFA